MDEADEGCCEGGGLEGQHGPVAVGEVILAVFDHGEAIAGHRDDEDAEIDHHGAEHAAVKGFVSEVLMHGKWPDE